MYYQFLQLYRNQYQQEQPPSEIYSKLHAFYAHHINHIGSVPGLFKDFYRHRTLSTTINHTSSSYQPTFNCSRGTDHISTEYYE